MRSPSNAPLAERAELLLGIGEPEPPSRFLLSVLLAVGALLTIGALLWYALSGGREGGPGYATAAPVFLWAWMLAENGGSYLYARRGAWWGRGLRVFGWAAFWPLSMALYLAYYWSNSTFMFVVLSTLVGLGVVWTAFRLVRLAWRRG